MKCPDVVGEVLDAVEVEGAEVALEHDRAHQAQVVEQLRLVRKSLAAIPANRMCSFSSDGLDGGQVPRGFGREQVREKGLRWCEAEASEQRLWPGPWTPSAYSRLQIRPRNLWSTDNFC